VAPQAGGDSVSQYEIATIMKTESLRPSAPPPAAGVGNHPMIRAFRTGAASNWATAAVAPFIWQSLGLSIVLQVFCSG